MGEEMTSFDRLVELEVVMGRLRADVLRRLNADLFRDAAEGVNVKQPQSDPRVERRERLKRLVSVRDRDDWEYDY